MTINNEIAQQIDAKRAFGIAVCDKIARSIAKLGFPENTAPKPPHFDAAVFSLITDPYNQSQNLAGFWYDAQQQRIGQIKFNSENGVYAEFDVVQNHPSKPGVFIEAINAWGQPDNIKVEAKLLDIPQ